MVVWEIIDCNREGNSEKGQKYEIIIMNSISLFPREINTDHLKENMVHFPYHDFHELLLKVRDFYDVGNKIF